MQNSEFNLHPNCASDIPCFFTPGGTQYRFLLIRLILMYNYISYMCVFVVYLYLVLNYVFPPSPLPLLHANPWRLEEQIDIEMILKI